MSDLPTGTVTFLFTDIESSTALGEQYPEAMSRALVRHDVLVEQHVAEHDGVVVRPRGEGDSRFAVFARASDAVAAAASLQQALHAEPWPTPTPLRVRMALHTGEADLREGDYYGSAVNRCARLRAVAHGGQTLVSLATEQLVRGQLGSGLALRDLGEHRLKDLRDGERIFQLIIDGLPTDFPPLKTLDARSHNLPVQPTSFIGREDEIAAARQRLLDPQVRLLTMTGPGGSGKTRLALQVAAELLDHFAEGVWLVELAPMHDPALVSSAIAAALGVKESGAQPLVEGLKMYLQTKQVLLVLDNFEQVVAAGSLIAELLQATPSLKVLVTSRVALHLRGEREVVVSPLSVPLLTDLPSPAALEEVAAVRLFVERARDSKADFVLTPVNARAVAEICVRLDGLPLAIELAAARSKMLAPQALLSRLDNRLKLLTGGARDLPARQQTLRGTIDWSFNLLDAGEQRLFTRLGVFVGGWTVEAAEAVCNADGDLGLDVLDGLQSLLDKSLLRQVEGADGEPRFRRLETIREYALEQLAASGEAEVLRERHLAFFLQCVEDGAAEGVPGERFRIDRDNLRTALDWALGGRNVVMGARLLHAIAPYALQYAQLTEWRTWLERALLSEDLLPAVLHTQIFFLAAVAAQWQSQADSAAVMRLRESRALFQAAGDTGGEADALHQLGRASRNRGDYEAATAALEQAQVLYQVRGDTNEIADVTGSLGAVALYQEAFPRALMLYEQALTLYRATGNELGVASCLHNLGEVAHLQGDDEQAAVCCREALTVFRRLDVPVLIAWSLHNAGYVADRQGATVLARTCFGESLSLFQDHELLDGIGVCLAGFARLAVSAGQADGATRLLAAAEAVAARIGGLHFPLYRAEKSRTVATTRAALGEHAFASAWAEGQAMTLEQAVAYALAEVPDG